MTKDFIKSVCGRSSACCLVAVFSVLMMTLAGCGGNQVATAPVTGTVTHNGQPVTGGSLVFAPVGGGKPASAEVGSDGTFELQSYAAGDGAAAGKYRISYTPPVMELPEGTELQPGETTPPSPYDGLAPKTSEVEISASGGQVDIELIGSGAAPAAEPSGETPPAE